MGYMAAVAVLGLLDDVQAEQAGDAGGIWEHGSRSGLGPGSWL